MSTAIALVSEGFSADQIEIIRSQVAPAGTTNDELAMFLTYCQRTGLDPFARQIYLSERRANVNGQWTITRKPETTIDGFRLIAERGGQYAGQLGPFWCGDDGVWRDVWTSHDPPAAARIGVLRHDFKEPLWAVALYDEYCQKNKEGVPNSMWKKMPSNQLAKCAESLALRRAFPRELSGLYTREEMPSEQTEAKEAQREYLASKGIDPEVSPKHQHNQPPPERPLNEFEQRKAKLKAEGEALLDEVSSTPKANSAGKKRGIIAFDKLKMWKTMKDELRAFTGTDGVYYGCLQAKGYNHANEISSEADALAIWKVLGVELKRLKERDESLKVLEQACEVIGQRAFGDLLGVHGCEKITDALSLSGDAWKALLAELKDKVEARKATSV